MVKCGEGCCQSSGGGIVCGVCGDRSVEGCPMSIKDESGCSGSLCHIKMKWTFND